MSEHCPLIGEHGIPNAPTTDKYGAVWDSGLPDLCMQTCFRAGQARAEQQGTTVTTYLASEEERLLAEGDTGMSEGILATSAVERMAYIDINDGTDPDAVLSSSQFSFTCTIEK